MSSKSDSAPALVRFDKIGQIALTVLNVARARNFYQNTLGMKLLFDTGHLAFFQCGDLRLMLGTQVRPEPRGGTILYFKVDDIQGTCAALKKREVKFIEEPHLIAKMADHDLWMAFLQDSEGNTLGVMCELKSA